MKKLSKLLILPLVILTIAGCGKVPVLENGQEAVITFDESSISVDTLYSSLKSTYGKYILIDLIDKEILNKKYETTDEETKYIEENIASFTETAKSYGYSVEMLLQYQYGINSIDEFKDQLSLSYRRNLAINEYLENELTDKEINNYYKNNIYGDIKVKHILIAPDVLDGMTSEEKTKAENEALATAKSIIKKLKNGTSFDNLVKEYSDDTSTVANNGELDWFNTGEMEAAFEEAAFELNKGKYTTTPVKTAYGYHIIYKIDAKEKPSLDDVKEDITIAIIANKLEEEPGLFYETLEEIRKEAGLKIIDTELNDAYKDYMKQLIENANSSN